MARHNVGSTLESAVEGAEPPDGPEAPPGATESKERSTNAAPDLPVLPTEARPVSGELRDKMTVIYGPPGIGKSTLASEWGKVLFLEFEPGLNDLEVLTTGIIPTWKDFAFWVEALRRDGGKSYDAFCIDTADVLVERCSEYTNEKLGIMHESDAEWGKGWSVAKKELTRRIATLAGIPNTGLVVISHAEDREIKTRNATITKSMPTLSKSARSVFIDMADLVLFCTFEEDADGERRVIRTKPSRYWEAKERGNPPRLPDTLEWPLGKGFEVLSKAWKDGKKK